MKEHELMSFPKREWKDIKKILAETGKCSTVRTCFELDKYRSGQIWETPWKDKVKIIKVNRYHRAEDIPTWTLMDKGMKISVRLGGRYGGSKWDHVIFKKI